MSPSVCRLRFFFFFFCAVSAAAFCASFTVSSFQTCRLSWTRGHIWRLYLPVYFSKWAFSCFFLLKGSLPEAVRPPRSFSAAFQSD